MTANDKAAAPTIDVQSDDSMNEWARKLNVTTDQLKEAVAAVGNRATDVELHLKGSRSTTNEESVAKATGQRD